MMTVCQMCRGRERELEGDQLELPDNFGLLAGWGCNSNQAATVQISLPSVFSWNSLGTLLKCVCLKQLHNTVDTWTNKTQCWTSDDDIDLVLCFYTRAAAICTCGITRVCSSFYLESMSPTNVCNGRLLKAHNSSTLNTLSESPLFAKFIHSKRGIWLQCVSGSPTCTVKTETIPKL